MNFINTRALLPVLKKYIHRYYGRIELNTTEVVSV